MMPVENTAKCPMKCSPVGFPDGIYFVLILFTVSDVRYEHNYFPWKISLWEYHFSSCILRELKNSTTVEVFTHPLRHTVCNCSAIEAHFNPEI